jgi:5-methyltetrahydrofolate--homocysteine methyltransferase
MRGCAQDSHPLRADRDAPAATAPAAAAPYAIEPVDETERRTRIARLKRLLSERIVFLDGAMGTMIQLAKLDEAGYRGERLARHGHDLKGNNDILTLTRPQLIADIHRAYLDAGADIIETNTFNSNSISQADYATSALVPELNYAATRLARKVADEVA